MRTNFILGVVLAAAMLSFVCGGCNDPMYGLTLRQQNDLHQWESEGVQRVAKKDTHTASLLGLVLGIGSFYTDQVALGVVDLLVWPLSAAWDSPLAAKRANQINYEATKLAWQEKTGRVAAFITRRSTSTGPIACDVRVVRVSDASVVASASGSGSRYELGKMTDEMVKKFKDESLKGKSITVASLRNRGEAKGGRAMADEVADKLMGSLVNTQWFNVKERLDLTSILSERDLESANLVKNPAVKEKLAGISYIVIGAVTLH